MLGDVAKAIALGADSPCVPGVVPGLAPEDGSPAEQLALHLAGANFAIKRANALSVAGWRPLFEQAAERASGVFVGFVLVAAAS